MGNFKKYTNILKLLACPSEASSYSSLGILWDVRLKTCTVDFVFISGNSGVLVNARGNIDRFRAITTSARYLGHDIKRGDIWVSLIICGSIHEGHEWFSNDSRGRREIFMCLAVLLCGQFCRFANGGAKISIKS